MQHLDVVVILVGWENDFPFQPVAALVFCKLEWGAWVEDMSSVYAEIQCVKGFRCWDVSGPWCPAEEIGPRVITSMTFYDDEAEIKVSFVDFNKVE